jgi:hypothetical protein
MIATTKQKEKIPDVWVHARPQQSRSKSGLARTTAADRAASHSSWFAGLPSISTLQWPQRPVFFLLLGAVIMIVTTCLPNTAAAAKPEVNRAALDRPCPKCYPTAQINQIQPHRYGNGCQKRCISRYWSNQIECAHLCYKDLNIK